MGQLNGAWSYPCHYLALGDTEFEIESSASLNCVGGESSERFGRAFDLQQLCYEIDIRVS